MEQVAESAELLGHLSMQAAQASNNVPARYDPAWLRHPTTPLTGRGCPIGLGVNLSVTEAGPATEMISVAAVAPAKVVATSPTVLHHSLRRLADGSRPPTPEGSRPACAWGDVATPVRPITGRLSLPPSCSTRSPIGSSYDWLSLAGWLRAYHVPRVKQGRVRSCLYAGGSSSTPDEFGASGPDHLPFGPGVSASCACSCVTTLTALHLG
jgi:hypothetical protein